MQGSEEFATINELAAREGIAVSYLSRVLRLTMFAVRRRRWFSGSPATGAASTPPPN